MEFYKVIDKRKSIREFESKKVPKSILIKLVKDAVKAPSAANSQPWEFYVIYSKKKRDKIAEILRKALKIQAKDFKKLSKQIIKAAYDFYANIGHCPHIILIYTPRIEKNIMMNRFLSVAAAIENLMLSAADKGLGTCWIGTFKTSKGLEKEVNSYLKIKNKELVAGILVGYPKKGYKPLIREKKKLKKVLFWR